MRKKIIPNKYMSRMNEIFKPDWNSLIAFGESRISQRKHAPFKNSLMVALRENLNLFTWQRGYFIFINLCLK